jgi:hypothetical protein
MEYFACAKKIESDPAIIDYRLTDKPLEEVLDEDNMIPHPFIIQCI